MDSTFKMPMNMFTNAGFMTYDIKINITQRNLQNKIICLILPHFMITNLQAVIPIDLGKIRLQYLVVLMISFSFALVYLENDNTDTKAVTVHSERTKRGWIKDGEKQVAINVPSRRVLQVI